MGILLWGDWEHKQFACIIRNAHKGMGDADTADKEAKVVATARKCMITCVLDKVRDVIATKLVFFAVFAVAGYNLGHHIVVPEKQGQNIRLARPPVPSCVTNGIRGTATQP